LSILVFVALAFVTHPRILHRYDRITAAIDASTRPGERIFVWGQFPQLYWASGRQPATRFLTSGFLTNFSGGRSPSHIGPEYAVDGAWDDFSADLGAHPPALIIDASAGTPFAADVLAVQEVERHVIRSWCVDQPADIAHAADAAAWRYEPVRRLALTGSDGIALCVRGELEAVRVVDLPRPADAQPRAAIVASVLVADERFTVVTTHLHDEAAVARQQLDALVTAIGASDGPLVLLGDLNLRPGDVTRPLGEAGLRVLDAPDTSPA